MGPSRINDWRERVLDQRLRSELGAALGRSTEVFQERTRGFAADGSDPLRRGLDRQAARGARDTPRRPPVGARTGRRAPLIMI